MILYIVGKWASLEHGKIVKDERASDSIITLQSDLELSRKCKIITRSHRIRGQNAIILGSVCTTHKEKTNSAKS